MSISIQQALEELEALTAEGRVATANELRSLAMQVSVLHDGKITVFYGDQLSDGTRTSQIVNSMADPNIRALSKTDAAAFLKSDAFWLAAEQDDGVNS